jgi:hypothetical protein
MRRRWRWLVWAMVGAASPAAAHHSLTGYDQARRIELAGEVAEFHFTQPHPYLVITVRPAAGAAQAWRLEMDNLFELEAIGVTRDTFKPRDRVLVTGGPDRGGARSLYLRRLDRPADGLRYEQVGSTPSLAVRGR